MPLEILGQLDIPSCQAQREQWMRVYKNRRGSYGLRKTTVSFEGTPIDECLIVENGNITLVLDYTRDKYGIREFAIRQPTALKLGPLEASDNWSLANDHIFLKCYIDSRLDHCF
jgi:hypothetical protein